MSGSKDEHSTSHIVQSLAVNLLIAIVKAVAAFFTKSGAMLAEALHSFSDCGNQALLLVGVRQARKPADALHPFGYGRALYFWSFLVALMLFMGGGVFSIYEGIHKLREPEPVQHVWAGIAVLAVSILLEGAATLSNIRELNKRRGRVSFRQYLVSTKDSDLIVVFGENAAAVVGLFIALASMLMAWVTGDGRWDGIGSTGIGVVLVGVAAFLAREVKSLLLGEAADPEIEESVHSFVAEIAEFTEIIHLRSAQQGPGEVLLAVKVACVPSQSIEVVANAIDQLEALLREKHPEVKWCFVEPDLLRPSLRPPV